MGETFVPQARSERRIRVAQVLMEVFVVLNALLVSFGVVFIAELGDKSQLMAMTFATRFKWWIVLAGITFSTALVHIASVGIGYALGSAIPTHLITVVAGVSMLVFAFWTWRGDTLSDDESAVADKVTRSVFFAVTSAFFLAELGDKTMLATITLTTQHDWVGVWIGSTVGMVAADGLAIAVGAMLGSKLPERAIAIGATVLFFGFGVWLLAEAWPDLSTVSRAVTAAIVAITVIGGLLVVRRAHRAVSASVSANEVTATEAAEALAETPRHGENGRSLM